MKSHHSEVIILGTGVVGLATALALAKNNIRVTVLDKAPQFQYAESPEVDARVFAIMPKSKNYFIELGVWQKIIELGVSPYRKMHVWENHFDQALQFSANDVGQSELGHIIEQRVLLKVLSDQCIADDFIHLVHSVEVREVTITQHSAVLTTDQGVFDAALIIGADGAHSWLRQKCNIALIQWDYQQQAIVATVTTEQEHQQCAWQRFLSTGPLAFLPLKNSQQCSIVWTLDNQECDAIFSLNDDAFIKALQTVWTPLGTIQHVSQRHRFPLSMRHAKQYVQSRVAFVGDALHTIHPLAGLGMNLGLQDSQQLAQMIVANKMQKRDIGAFHHLRPFERARKGQNMAVIALMEGLKHLFASDNRAIKSLRQWGINRVNDVQWFKNKIISEFN